MADYHWDYNRELIVERTDFRKDQMSKEPNVERVERGERVEN